MNVLASHTVLCFYNLLQVVTKAQNSLLSQALQKDGSSNSLPQTKTAEPKGVIDLTDEDDKKSTPSATKAPAKTPTPVNKVQAAVRATAVPQGVSLLAPQIKPSVPGVVTGGGPRLMYVLQPNQQLSNNVITTTAATGTTKAVMLKFTSNGLLGEFDAIARLTSIK